MGSAISIVDFLHALSCVMVVIDDPMMALSLLKGLLMEAVLLASLLNGHYVTLDPAKRPLCDQF